MPPDHPYRLMWGETLLSCEDSYEVARTERTAWRMSTYSQFSLLAVSICITSSRRDLNASHLLSLDERTISMLVS